MFRLFCMLAFIGVAYGCVIQAEVDTINTEIANVEAVLALAFSDPPTTAEVIAVLDTVCTPGDSANDVLLGIEALVNACRELEEASSLSTFYIGPLSVASLLSHYKTVAEFCGCLTSSLNNILAITDLYESGALTVTDASFAYPDILNFPTWCANASVAIPVDLVDSVTAIYNDFPTCGVYNTGSLLTSSNIEVISQMVIACPTDLTSVDANFLCVLDISATVDFKDCMDAAASTSSPKCNRRECVTDYMKEPCGEDISTVYMYVVEAVYTGTISDSVCDGVGTITASIALMLVTVICSMFF